MTDFKSLFELGASFKKKNYIDSSTVWEVVIKEKLITLPNSKNIESDLQDEFDCRILFGMGFACAEIEETILLTNNE